MKNIFLLLAIVLYALPTYAETSDCWVHVKLDPEKDAPGHLLYDELKQSCNGAGIDCEIVPCDIYFKGKEERVTGGIMISDIELKPIGFQLLDENGLVTQTFEREPENYTMINRFTLRIDESENFPEIEGIEISLEGVSTNEYGKFRVFTPSGGY